MPLLQRTYLSIISSFFIISISFGQSIDLALTGYDMHIELNWKNIPSADRYEIWRKAPGENDFSIITSTRQLRLQDWTGRSQDTSGTYTYYISALTVPGVIITTSDTLQRFVFEMSDDQFLDMVQEYTFRYFWEYAHPVSKMARERLGSDDIVTTGGT